MSEARIKAIQDAIELQQWAVRAGQMMYEDQTNATMWQQLSESLHREALRRLRDARAIHREMVV